MLSIYPIKYFFDKNLKDGRYLLVELESEDETPEPEPEGGPKTG